MLFNSIEFAVFFGVIFSLYLLLNHKNQNILLFFASCIFYAWWDIRFLGLLFFSIAVDYFCAIQIEKSKSKKNRKLFLLISLISNLGILAFFKYFNFFIDTGYQMMKTLGLNASPAFLKVTLPIGISFYTFKALSYTIDVYRKELKATRHFQDFALFVTFFPQLIAGPIDRASHFLPQILKPRRISKENLKEGCFLIFWGLYLKMFVADGLAKIVNPVFAGNIAHGGDVLLGLYSFAFQIYGDFAGYSSIARGLGKCMGFDLIINFNLPYFSQNPREFWTRWHISLSNWFRNYLYIPLGGNQRGNLRTYWNLFLTMLIAGLWHGAAWHFVLWGMFHGILLMLHRFQIRLPNWGDKIPASIKILLFFHLTCLGWLLFRAGSLTQINTMIQALFLHFQLPDSADFIRFLYFVAVLIIIEFFQYRKNDLMLVLKLKPAFQILIYIVMFYSLLLSGATGSVEFIYFQF